MAKDWTALLKKILPPRCLGRPFVCEGLPDASQVIIIGDLSATDVPTDLWTYWHPETGFDYDRFMAAYRHFRRENDEPELSPTRRRLSCIRESGIRAVETNVYRMDGAEKVSNLDVLRLLIANMSDLKAIVLHGQKAQCYEKDLPLRGRSIKIFHPPSLVADL